MSKLVTAVFEGADEANHAAKQIKEAGLRTSDISIVARQSEEGNDSGRGGSREDRGFTMGRGEGDDTRMVNDNVSDGTIAGSVIGSVAGLLLGFGLIAIPGLGIIAAAGPVAGIISGAITGGIVGGLVDLGIPEEKSKEYEQHIKEGKVIFSMKTKDENVQRVSSILRESGGQGVEAF